MVNRKVIRKHNSPVTTGIINRYDDGGSIWDISKLFTKENLGKLGLGLLGPAGNAANGLISNGLSSGAGNAVNKVGSTVGSAISTVNPLLGGIVSAGTGLIGGITNALFGSKINEENVNNVRNSNNALSTVKVDSSSNDSILNQWSNQDFGADFSQSDIGKDGLFSDKAEDLYNELKKEQEIARGRALLSYDNAIESADKMNDLRAMSNYMAKGGKIHIKPENRGKFTALKKRTGKSASWFKEHGTPAQKKMATFALNARKWKHDDGGWIDEEFTLPYSAYIADRVNNMGLNNSQKAAVYSSIYGESRFNPYAYNPRGGGKGAHGIMQWRGARIPESSYLPSQMDYLENTLNSVDRMNWLSKRSLNNFKKSNTPEASSSAFERGYVRGEEFSRTSKRKKARSVYDKMHTPSLSDLSDYNMRTITKPNIQIPFNPFGDGGLMGTHGADFTNGVTVINNGGYHEENPHEGVQIGVDYNGIPNLVEEGEVIYNDYVFSNRIKVPDSVKQRYKLKGGKGLTFADAAKKIQKESEERPNDPISKRGLEDGLIKLMQEQEALRGQGQYGLEGVQYAEGGLIPDDYTYTPVFGSWKSGEMPEVTATAKRPSMIKYVDYDIPSTIEPIGIDGLYAGFSGLSPMEISGIGEVGYDIPSNVEGTTPAKVRVPKRKGNTDRRGFDATWLRYAPVVGSAIGLGQSIFSRPDYTGPDAIIEAANKVGNYVPVSYKPIGNYLQYKPLDRNFYINKLGAQAGATRRAIMNSSSPSRNAALLAADYNAQGKLGDLARQAEEYNLAQRQMVEQFNRGTNQANSEMGLKAAMANQEAALKAGSTRLSGITQAMAMRDAIDARRGASMSANLTNLFDSLGNIGIDAYNRSDRDMLINSGVFGTLSQKPKEWSKEEWEDYKMSVAGGKYSKGGKLKKRRGGLTY
jgi:hypothetical protein